MSARRPPRARAALAVLAAVLLALLAGLRPRPAAAAPGDTLRKLEAVMRANRLLTQPVHAASLPEPELAQGCPP